MPSIILADLANAVTSLTVTFADLTALVLMALMGPAGQPECPCPNRRPLL